MLPKTIRLNLRQYPDFFADADSLASRRLRILFKENFIDRELRLAIIVPKRHGGAVQRVKTKRQLRHASMTVKQEQPKLFTLPYSVALLVRGGPQNYQLYKQEVEQLLSQLIEFHSRSIERRAKTKANEDN